MATISIGSKHTTGTISVDGVPIKCARSYLIRHSVGELPEVSLDLVILESEVTMSEVDGIEVAEVAGLPEPVERALLASLMRKYPVGFDATRLCDPYQRIVASGPIATSEPRITEGNAPTEVDPPAGDDGQG